MKSLKVQKTDVNKAKIQTSYWRMQNKIIIKTRLIHWPWHFLHYYFTFCDSALENQMWTALSFHAFMVILLQIYSLSLMLWTDIKESLMIKPSAPVSSALASVHYVHTTLFEYQAPTPHCKHSPFFFFVSIILPQDSTQTSMGQQVQISWPQAPWRLA